MPPLDIGCAAVDSQEPSCHSTTPTRYRAHRYTSRLTKWGIEFQHSCFSMPPRDPSPLESVRKNSGSIDRPLKWTAKLLSGLAAPVRPKKMNASKC